MARPGRISKVPSSPCCPQAAPGGLTSRSRPTPCSLPAAQPGSARCPAPRPPWQACGRPLPYARLCGPLQPGSGQTLLPEAARTRPERPEVSSWAPSPQSSHLGTVFLDISPPGGPWSKQKPLTRGLPKQPSTLGPPLPPDQLRARLAGTLESRVIAKRGLTSRSQASLPAPQPEGHLMSEMWRHQRRGMEAPCGWEGRREEPEGHRVTTQHPDPGTS